MSEPTAVSHLGVCVSEIDRSIDFYTNALDFKLVHRFESSGGFENLIAFDNFSASYAFLQNGPIVLELVCYSEPSVEGVGEAIALNRAGLSYLCMRVPDIDQVCDRIEMHGGHAFRASCTPTPQGTLMFCADPDGIRIELLQR